MANLKRFYLLLDRLSCPGQAVVLTATSRSLPWPRRGVYFFFEPGEMRSGTGEGPRAVRVGTHALKTAASSTLWGRLSQHRGSSRSLGGNHRGSVYRLLIGASLAVREPTLASATWGRGGNALAEIKAAEHHLEAEVSKTIGAMSVITFDVDDEPGPASLRGHIERSAIALLSNWRKEPVDPPSLNWLGRFCPRKKVRLSGLWNNNHVDENYDPAFLDIMEHLIEKSASRNRP
jgi:hypothetical protein